MQIVRRPFIISLKFVPIVHRYCPLKCLYCSHRANVCKIQLVGQHCYVHRRAGL